MISDCISDTGCVKSRLPVISPDLSPPVTDTATGDSGSTAAKCPLCQLPLGSVECFDFHIERDGAGYKCQVCNRRKRDKSTVRRHLRVHTGEMPFSCPHCPYRAARKDGVSMHVRHRHEGELCFLTSLPKFCQPAAGDL